MDTNSEEYYNAYYQWWFLQQQAQAQAQANAQHAQHTASVGGYNAGYYSYMNNQQFYPSASGANAGPSRQSRQSKPKKQRQQPQAQQPQQDHCTQCTHSGTKKQVELHMMDRHLIYPPGFLENEERKRASKPAKPIVPVEGTNIMLDTPEAINDWIAERKSRFPSAANLAEKERVREDKKARGELPLHPKFGGSLKGSSNHKASQAFQPSQIPKKRVIEEADDNDGATNDADDADDAPESVSSKIPPSHPPKPSHLLSQPRLYKNHTDSKPKHKNQFEQPNLMAKLFNDEIRQSVSYLSQTIRFLVANDFLDNVELQVGQAEAPKMVEEME
ncbi:hypothetical protein E3P78_01305 [Wallemia ichthyophaga]|nr:hypothetical protein E3P78_01305 [Wallemia ichthyophaga]